MTTLEHLPLLLSFVFILSLVVGTEGQAQEVPLAWMKDSQSKLEKELVSKYGEEERTRLQQGLKQVASF